MLTLYDSSGVPAYPLDVPAASFFITHVYGGLDTLSFDISPKHPVYVNIAEEIQVEYADILYKIKSVNERATTSTIGCIVDLDFLKETVHLTYTSSARSLREVLSDALHGWTLEDVDLVTVRPNMELTNCTDYDIVMQAMETYGVVYEWHNKNHRLKIIKPELIQPSGQYLTDELNLKQLTFKGSSSDIITRLYPIGKDGLTIAEVNGGKAYVEDRSYCDQVISAIWSDDRYTDAQSLKNDALERLKTTAYPVRSYECSVQDLAKVEAAYSHLSFELYQIVTLIDRQRQTRIDHRVMEYKEYPLQPDLNVVTLANVATKITAEIKRVETKFDGEIEVDRRVLKELREDADSMSIRISNTYTKGETDTEIASQITQATGNIRLEVSETYATKAEVEQIQVGGRNLLANSDIMETRTKDATDTKMYSLQVVDGYDLDTLINEELTVSVYMYSPGERDWSLVESVGMRNRFGIYVYIMWANDAGGTEATSPNTNLLSQAVDGKRIHATITATPPEGYTHMTKCAVYVCVYARPASTNDATWVLSQPKLELGNKATDWTPAPEDTSEAINEAMTTVIERTSAALDIANDNILSTVASEYSKKSELEEVRQYTDTKVQQTADSITYTFSTVQEALDLLDGKVDQNKLDLEEYIRFAGALIELGKRGSPFVAKLDNTKLAFLQDGREIAYISNNTLNITDAIIKGKLTMTMVGGFFDWVPEQNGSMSLVWRDA